MATHAGFLLPNGEVGKGTIAPAWTDAPAPLSSDYDGWETSASPGNGVSTSTQPVTENPVIHTGTRLIGFADDFYNRILIEPNTIDAGNLISDQFYEVSVFNGYFEDKELIDLSVQNPEGLSIIGPLAGTIWGQLETKTYQITISADGPPTIDSAIQLDWPDLDDDIIIPVVGARIVMLPYQAEAPWSETLEWKTNVLTANNGNEQRIRLRKKARQKINATYPIPEGELQRAFNMAYGWVHRAWAVALWSEIQYVGSIASGGTAIYCDTTKYDFRADSLVCIWQSPTENEVIEVESVFSDNLSLKRVLHTEYTNAYIMPVRIGMTNGKIGRSLNGYSSNLQIEYEFKDNVDLAPSAPSQFLGYDIYYGYNLMPGGYNTEDSITVRMDTVDYEVGVQEYFAPWVNVKRARNVYFQSNTPAGSWGFKQWLHRRAGRLRPFWLPTFEHNLRISDTGVIGSSFMCHDDAYKNLGNKHTHIAIQYVDNTWRSRTITGVSVEPGAMIRVAIDTALDIDVSQIKLISFLTLNRLDTDRVEIDWIGGGVSESTIRVLEIAP